MDKTLVCGTGTPGSIPGGSTQVKQKHYSAKNSVFVLETELLQFRACVLTGVMF
ncbi:MAG: hypothetical protein RLZZ230_37 [Candidatus Parcubacteria bacterium]